MYIKQNVSVAEFFSRSFSPMKNFTDVSNQFLGFISSVLPEIHLNTSSYYTFLNMLLHQLDLPVFQALCDH